jgi:GT2 family glycosyltransferase
MTRMQKCSLSKAHAISPSECVIIIVAWNCWEHLYRCLDALSAQTTPGFRVVIVDNGDAEDQQIERASGYPNVFYVRSPSNLGFAAGNNRGMELAQGASWIILLNPDTLPAIGWFEKMMGAAVRYPDFAVFGSKLLQADNPTVLDGEGDCYHVSGMAWRSGMGLSARSTPNNEPWEVFSPCAAAALYKADALKCVEGFDEDFFCYMEDVDLGFRLRLAGYRCLTVPDAEVLHVGSATTVKRSPFYVYYGPRPGTDTGAGPVRGAGQPHPGARAAQARGGARALQPAHRSCLEERRLPAHLAVRFRNGNLAPGQQRSASTGRAHPVHSHATGGAQRLEPSARRAPATSHRRTAMKPPLATANLIFLPEFLR